MKDEYSIQVNGEHDFSFTSTEIDEIDVLPIGKNKFHLLKDHISFKTEILSADYLKKHYKVEVNGNTYAVDISNDLDRLIKEMGFELGAGKMVNDVHAPMPGLIFEIMVAEGDEVAEGDSLLILEAMKMENVIASPRDGVIKSIVVTKGQAIEKNHLLIEFE